MSVPRFSTGRPAGVTRPSTLSLSLSLSNSSTPINSARSHVPRLDVSSLIANSKFSAQSDADLFSLLNSTQSLNIADIHARNTQPRPPQAAQQNKQQNVEQKEEKEASITSDTAHQSVASSSIVSDSSVSSSLPVPSPDSRPASSAASSRPESSADNHAHASHIVSPDDPTDLNALLRNSVRRYSILADAIQSHKSAAEAAAAAAAHPEQPNSSRRSSVSATVPSGAHAPGLPSKDGSHSPGAGLSAVDRAAADPESVDWRGLLTKPPEQRSTEDVDLIYTYIKHLKIAFLRQLAPELVHQLCKHFVLEVYEKGENVFQQGDIGTHFFIILHGVVSIRIREEEEELLKEVEEKINAEFGDSNPGSKNMSRNASQETLHQAEHIDRAHAAQSGAAQDDTPSHAHSGLSSKRLSSIVGGSSEHSFMSPTYSSQGKDIQQSSRPPPGRFTFHHSATTADGDFESGGHHSMQSPNNASSSHPIQSPHDPHSHPHSNRHHTDDVERRHQEWLQQARKERMRAELMKATQEVMSMGPGQAFGEVALLQPKNRRTATVACKERTFLLSLEKKHYLIALKDKVAQERNRKLAFIQSHPLFKRLSHEKQTSLAVQLKERHVARSSTLIREGDTIQREGENAPVLIFVASGELIVKKEVHPELIHFGHKSSQDSEEAQAEAENGKSSHRSRRRQLHRALATELAQSALLSAEDYALLLRLGDLDSTFSQQIELSRIGEGGYIGEEAILLESETHYHSTVVASVSSLLYTLSSHNFHRFIRGPSLTQIIELCRQREALRSERVKAIIKDYLMTKQNSSANAPINMAPWLPDLSPDEAALFLASQPSAPPPALPTVFHKRPTSPKRRAIHSLKSGMIQINMNRQLRKEANARLQPSRPATSGAVRPQHVEPVQLPEIDVSLSPELVSALTGAKPRDSHLASLTNDKIPLSALSALKPLPDPPMRPASAGFAPKSPAPGTKTSDKAASIQRARRNSQLSLLLGVGTGMGMHAVQDSNTGEVFVMGKSDAKLDDYKQDSQQAQRPANLGRSFVAPPPATLSVNERLLNGVFSRAGQSRKARQREFRIEIPLEIARKVNPFRPLPKELQPASLDSYSKKTAALVEKASPANHSRGPEDILNKSIGTGIEPKKPKSELLPVTIPVSIAPQVIPFSVGSISALDNPMKKSRNAPRSTVVHQVLAQQLTRKLTQMQRMTDQS